MSKFKPTGFYAFWFEQVLKRYHFKKKDNSKIDIMCKTFPYRKTFLKMWNNSYADYHTSRDYLSFEETLLPSRDEYIRCFCYYFIRNNKRCSVHEMVKDSFSHYFYMEKQFRDIKDTFKTDFNNIIKFSKLKNKSFKEILFTNDGFSDVFIMFFHDEISIFGLFILDSIFGIFDKIQFNSMNIVDEDKLNKIEVIFDKILPIIYTSIHKLGIDWKSEMKQMVNEM